MVRGAMLLAFLLATIGTATNAFTQDIYVPDEAPAARSELQVFLDRNPDAVSVRSSASGESPYNAFLAEGSLLRVFDGAGNLARRAPVEAAVALPFEGLAIAMIPLGNGAANNKVRLLGFAAGKEDELALRPVKGPDRKLQRARPWLEDVDGDGRLEVSVYDDRALRCVRWNAADGKWEWIEALEGKTIERDRPPIRWRIRGSLDGENRIVRGELRARNLTGKLLRLAPPPAPLFGKAFPGDRTENPPKAAVSFVSDNWTFGVENMNAEITLLPAAEVEFAFEAQPDGADVPVGDKLSFRVIGRARWRRFDAVFDLPLTMTFNDAPLADVDPGLLTVPDVLSGRISQDELDRCVMVLAANRRHVPPEMFEGVSDDVRYNLATQALLGGGGYTILKESVADATVLAILKAVADTPDAAPVNVEQLLWLALMNLDPDEYADALEKAGGIESLPDEVLARLLAYRGNLLDIEALARIAAEARPE